MNGKSDLVDDSMKKKVKIYFKKSYLILKSSLILKVSFASLDSPSLTILSNHKGLIKSQSEIIDIKSKAINEFERSIELSKIDDSQLELSVEKNNNNNKILSLKYDY